MSKSRRRPRHRRSHRATRVAAPVVVGGAVAAAAFGSSPLADHLRPAGPGLRPTPAVTPEVPSPDVVLVQPAGPSYVGGSSRDASRAAAGHGGPTAASRSAQRAAAAAAASTPTDTGSAPRPSGSSSTTPSDPAPSGPVPLPLPTTLPTQAPTLPLP